MQILLESDIVKGPTASDDNSSVKRQPETGHLVRKTFSKKIVCADSLQIQNITKSAGNCEEDSTRHFGLLIEKEISAKLILASTKIR